MPTNQYHEPPDELGADARRFARRKEKWRLALQKILFTDGDAVDD